MFVSAAIVSERGLVTPVLRAVEKSSLSAISAREYPPGIW